MRLSTGLALLTSLHFALSATPNFPYEETQLTQDAIDDLIALSYGNTSDPAPSLARCKSQPGDDDWPLKRHWRAFGRAVDKVLLEPTPPGSACYPDHPNYDAERCEFLVEEADRSRFWIDDPVTAVVEWAQGNTCPAEIDPAGECTQGGYPTYVVNATSVRHIQMAVNWARNKNIRLTIRNTGHEFSGRSTGYASLSIWTHHLKGIKLLDDYEIGDYKGGAVKIAAGAEGWDAIRLMNESSPGITIIAPGQNSVGLAGGWLQGGGHTTISGYYGLAADQVLSLNVVTADGHFVTANMNENQDLFYALRGGGGGTYGVVTSTIVKAYPGHTNISGLSFSFTTGPLKRNASVYDLFPTSPTIEISDLDTFWQAFAEYLSICKETAAAKGFAFADVTPVGNDSYTFASMFAFSQTSPSEAQSLLESLFERFKELGINIITPTAVSVPYARLDPQPGTVPGQPLFASRLLPQALWDDTERFEDTLQVLRHAVEDGDLQIRSRGYTPTLDPADYPTTVFSSGVNPALRESMMHLMISTLSSDLTAHSTSDEWLDSHATVERYMNDLRDLTPDGGAYVNEADVLEPDWQQSFWGDKYPELLKVKRERDPWDLFWASRMVGSEGWEVETESEVPDQNGPLCRTTGA